MSDIKTRTLFEGQHVRAEALADGKPLTRPIYFRDFRKGCYLSAVEAVQIADELMAAVAASAKAGQ